MNKEDRALEALLALAFRTDLTDEEVNELFSKPVQLSKEDEEMIRNVDIDEIIFGHKKRAGHF
jgi:hypothetical protein